jgi:pyruvate dehydrogenase E2 component (dihydrolipoamide acetyltransferase)
MAKEVIMPKFGFTQEDSQIVEWLVKEGEAVEAGDPLLEVTTDKVNMEVEAPVSGILAGVRAAVGDVVPVTQVIAYILAPGEALVPVDSALAPDAVSDAEPVQLETAHSGRRIGSSATSVAARFAAAMGVDVFEVPGSGPRGRVTKQDVETFLSRAPGSFTKVRATPAARRIAREAGLDLASVKGNGPRGRIQAQQAALMAGAKDTPVVAPVVVPQAAAPNGLIRVPFTTMRRTIARTLQRSMQEAPHVTFQADIDMTSLQALVARANELRPPDTDKITLTAALTRIVAWSLRRHPTLNSHLSEDEIIIWPVANIGIAVALDDGLLVPVVKDAGGKGIGQLSKEIHDLSRRARQGKLKPEELADGTFSISNLGMMGIDRFTAIINPPQVAILAVGRTNRLFVPDEQDQPVLKPICAMTLSVDHRVIDGATAARFMADLRDAVQVPELMLL